jgi:hypothetical protein
MRPKPEAEDEVRAFAFWHLLNDNSSGDTYFLAIAVFDSATGKSMYADPTDDFMKRFDGARSPVRKLSESATHSGGRKLYVGEIRWLNDRVVKIGCSMTCGILCGYGYELTLAFTWRGWTITEEGPRWVS